jgi:hypothetical protein
MKKTFALTAVLVSGTAIFLAVDTAETDPRNVAPPPGNDPHDTPHVTRTIGQQHTDAAPDHHSDTVLGLRVRKDRNCSIELQDFLTDNGETISAYRCVPETPRQPHPYAHYDDGSLEVLAWSDAEAAALLGRRLAASDRSRSYQLLLRAAALGGDARHLSWLADQVFSAIRIDGDLHVYNVKRRYELAAVASRLGGDRTVPQFLRKLLVDQGLSDASLTALDARVETMLESVRDIQRSVHGEVRYGGQDDV